MAQEKAAEAGEKLYTLDIPQREGKEGYIGTFLSSHLNAEAVLKSPEFSREPIRIYYLFEARVSLVPNEEDRQKIYDKLEEKLTYLEKKYKKDRNISGDLTAEQHSHLLITASLRTMGLVTDFVADHIGLTSQNKVGFVRRQKKPKKIESETIVSQNTKEETTDVKDLVKS
jgi:hypothetical protein